MGFLNFVVDYIGQIVRKVTITTPVEQPAPFIANSVSKVTEYFHTVLPDTAGLSATLNAVDWTNVGAIIESLQPLFRSLQPALDFVAENPWILAPLLIPAIQAWLVLLGFGEGGVVAGSIAALIQSKFYGAAIPQGSLFAFLQSNGAGGFANQALRMAGMWVVIGVLLAGVGKAMKDMGVLEEGKISEVLGEAWEKTLKWDVRKGG